MRWWIGIILICWGRIAWGAPQELDLSVQARQAVEQLLVLPAAETSPAPEAVAEMVRLVRSLPDDSAFALPKRGEISGAVSVFTVNAPFSRVVPYAYHPDVPSYATMPSSIRFQEWTTEAAKEGMRQLVSDLGTPRVVHGIEREVISPNLDTGGYYEYMQHRAVAVSSVSGDPVLISVACQEQPSSVGKRGLVVGEDRDWNYLFSNTVGLGGLLGWVKSYMYEGCSIAVFVPEGDRTRVASFKWLRAGWAGINMVKPEHILAGMRRFAVDFRAVLESPRLPLLAEAIALAKKVRALSSDRLQSLAQGALSAMQAQVRDQTFAALLESGKYRHSLSRDELVRLAFLEIWKCRLGRASHTADCSDAVLAACP
ncbi:hypothetical protein TDMWS_10610 [Thermodesulfomicrobium sp. WS]|uniref:hypothetical protein n=1 Tax=Thermodesulfomicrobium sp. WS TaxID=3004129 RepID=UPI0024914D2E|nr:hypothetical protein [Thermodesulfomicrobium sp. WS]BDV00976.1 hypothetical protein TDMWS_10610 [Thermodesulfomicrobium sp. WS]